MDPKNDIKTKIEEILGIEVELEKDVISPKEQEKIHFNNIMYSWETAWINQNQVFFLTGIDLSVYNQPTFAALENFTFMHFTKQEVIELIMWYIYKRPVLFGEEIQYLKIFDQEDNEIDISSPDKLYDVIQKILKGKIEIGSYEESIDDAQTN